MSIFSQAKEEKQRKALQRDILRAAQNSAQTGERSVRKRDWGSMVLIAIIAVLVIVAIFLFWTIATGRLRVPTANAATPQVAQQGDTTPNMDDAWQDAVLPPTVKIDPYYVEDTVFLGDSNTVRLRNYGFVEESQCFAQDSIGIGAVTYLRLAGPNSYAYGTYDQTMVESIAELQPKRVLMTFGTNDIGGSTTAQFVQTYREALAAIRDVSDCDIIINSIYPADQWSDYQNLQSETIIEFNEALEHMCKQEGIPFLNSWEALADEDGWCKPEYTVEDGVHLSEEGLEAVLDYYRSHAYIKE